MKLTFDLPPGTTSVQWTSTKRLLETTAPSDERTAFLQDLATAYGHNFVPMSRCEAAVGESNETRGKQFRFPILHSSTQSTHPTKIFISNFMNRELNQPNLSDTPSHWTTDELKELGLSFLRVMRKHTSISGVCFLNKEAIRLPD